jgi:16S rRNA (adenine1518-N6/adenine1519-N6)-dimethyltransferase
VTAASRVLEVGPGLGSLTLGLLETGALVTAVEIDPCLAEQLPKTVAALQPEHAMNFSLVLNDALKVTATDLAAAVLDADNPDRPFLLVSNLPYNAAVPILLTLLEKCRGLRSAVVLVQDEVADRLSAASGSKCYGVPSVKLAWYGKAFKAGKVARSVFWPVPNVDSALVAFVRREAPLGDNDLRRRTFRLVDAAFGQRRKTLRAALKGLISADAIAAAGIDPTLRGEKLTVDDFVRLAKACQTNAE